MAYDDNDPAELARIKFPGYTDERRVKIVESARAAARKDGGGIALLPAVSVDALLNEADRAVTAAAKVAGETAWTDAELDYIRDAKETFGKNAVAAGNPAQRRGEFLRKWGLERYNAELAKWGATADVRVAGRNPYKAVKGLKKALRGERLEATEFNSMLHPEKVEQPKPTKLTPEQKSQNPFMPGPSFNVTAQGALYKSDPALARQMAARAGVRL